MTIWLLGIAHSMQVWPNVSWQDGGPIVDLALADRFRDYLASVIDEIAPTVIAEEYSATRLQQVTGGGVLVAQALAAGSHATHLLCDPDSEERTSLYTSHSTTEDADRGNGFPIRESFWLERLRPLIEASRILFICGADHVLTFKRRLEDEAITVTVVSADLPAKWGMDAGESLR